MGKDLVFVGGGHAHLTAMVKLKDYLDRGHRVTLISPIVRHYYSGMGPGMLSGIYAPHEIRFNVKKLVEDRGARFVLGKVIRVDPERRILTLEDKSEVSYHVVSFNTGSFVPLDLIKGSMERVYPVKPHSQSSQGQKGHCRSDRRAEAEVGRTRWRRRRVGTDRKHLEAGERQQGRRVHHVDGRQ